MATDGTTDSDAGWEEMKLARQILFPIDINGDNIVELDFSVTPPRKKGNFERNTNTKIKFKLPTGTPQAPVETGTKYFVIAEKIDDEWKIARENYTYYSNGQNNFTWDSSYLPVHNSSYTNPYRLYYSDSVVDNLGDTFVEIGVGYEINAIPDTIQLDISSENMSISNSDLSYATFFQIIDNKININLTNEYSPPNSLFFQITEKKGNVWKRTKNIDNVETHFYNYNDISNGDPWNGYYFPGVGDYRLYLGTWDNDFDDKDHYINIKIVEPKKANSKQKDRIKKKIMEELEAKAAEALEAAAKELKLNNRKEIVLSVSEKLDTLIEINKTLIQLLKLA